ncbi:MAG: hypothetical protein MUC59_03975 [Saprospiraceae bacterium]|jgi:hypothetical protein|nr:hypothetical protein [Saprospiraceae bacterium]
MEKSHLVNILRVLEKKEVRELRKWVSSPAHNQRQDVVDLYEYLVTGQHLFSEKQLEKEQVFRAIYPERTFSDAEMRQVMHFLLKAVENFLVYNELLKDEVRTQTMLAKVYRKRQLPKLFQKTIEMGQQTQQQQPYRNHQYFENEYALQFEQYTYLSGLGRNTPLNLQEVSDANDVAYLANKLQLSCIMLSHQAVFNTTYRLQLLDELLAYLENNRNLLGIPAIAIYYHQFKAMTQPDLIEHYHLLKKEIFENGRLFPNEEIRVIYLLTINYCIGRINAGISTFFRETFDLYNEGLDKSIFIENGVLSRFTFQNAVTAGLNLKDFEWVEKFIKNYRSLLAEKHQESFVQFNKARLFFEQGNYNDAMKLLAQSDYDDILMALNARAMLLKMYYELNEMDALDSLIESMKSYIQRKKVMGYHRDIFKNLISCTKKLLRIIPGDTIQIEKAKKDIKSLEPLMERKWLLEQLDKLG